MFGLVRLASALLGMIMLVPVVRSQAIIWTQEVPFTHESRVIRDGSSNFYLATLHSSSAGHFVHVRKFNALGTEQWTTSRYLGPNSLSASMPAIALLNQDVFVLGCLSSPQTPSLRYAIVFSFSMATGGGTQYTTASNFMASDLAANAGRLALAGTDDSGNAIIQYLNPTAMEIESYISWSTGVAFTAGLTIDPSGFAYGTATLADGRVRIVKASEAGTVSWTTTFNMASHTEESIRLIAHNPSDNRVYAIGQGRYVQSPFDRDCLLYVMNASTGGPIVARELAVSSSDEWPDDISLNSGSGAVISIYRSPDNLRLARVDALGSILWTVNVPETRQATFRRLARDPDGNVLVGTHYTFTKFRRFSSVTGSAIGEVSLPSPSSWPQVQTLTDPAGNIYVTQSSATSTLLRRVQPARLELAMRNVVGGSQVEGSIRLWAAASNAQVWSLNTSLYSAATVPSTLTINAGTSIGAFPITTYPVSNNLNVTISARHNGFILQTTLTLLAPVAALLTLQPNTITGGLATVGTIALTGSAPAGGKSVALSVDKPSVASVPASVTVPAGDDAVTFPVDTFTVSANQGVVLTASTGTVSKTRFFAVNAPSLTTVSLAPSVIQGGLPTTLWLNISGIAPSGGWSIVLLSGAPGIALVPSTGAVPAGMTTGSVTINTTAVTTSTSVLVFATRAGIYRTATLTVTP